MIERPAEKLNEARGKFAAIKKVCVISIDVILRNAHLFFAKFAGFAVRAAGQCGKKHRNLQKPAKRLHFLPDLRPGRRADAKKNIAIC